MRDKEQIMIDGCNVSGCENYRPKDRFTCYPYICNCHQKPDCYYKQLACKTQECEELKAEEKYLKQCCQKAGEELAKHSFEYDGKEKNLVVQAIELNEKYEKFKKALEEIEDIVQNRIINDFSYWSMGEISDDIVTIFVIANCKQVLGIINKVKGE